MKIFNTANKADAHNERVRIEQEKNPIEEKSLFDRDDDYMNDIYKMVFKDQDDMAEQSKVFKEVLLSEIHEDPKTRYEQTNNPKAKTRNALISRGAYENIVEWEDNLLTNPFYGLV